MNDPVIHSVDAQKNAPVNVDPMNDSDAGNTETEYVMKVIAHMESDFSEKFGIPRQSGLVPELRSRIVFEETYRNPHALTGLDDFSHIWILWGFSKAVRKGEGWSPTVTPPRLGGNKRMGVFATRSPFRPNPIGLSSVKLEKIELGTPEGPVLWVSGADLLDGTPIFDIKPYLAYTDAHTQAVCGFADSVPYEELEVDFPPELLEILPASKRAAAVGILRQDPRPSYQHDPSRRYGVAFAGYDIRFYTDDHTLRVCEVVKLT